MLRQKSSRVEAIAMRPTKIGTTANVVTGEFGDRRRPALGVQRRERFALRPEWSMQMGRKEI